MAAGPLKCTLNVTLAGVAEFCAAVRKLDAAMRGVSASFTQFSAAFNGQPPQRDAACERFLVGAMAPHWKRAPQYCWKPPAP